MPVFNMSLVHRFAFIGASLTIMFALPLHSEPVAPMSNAVFAKPVQLRGKLGGDTVQMLLQPKTEDIDSVEGSYIVFGGKRNHGSKILLAGEVSGNKLTMEESEDGVDVSGQWDGELKGNTLRGIWQSDDGKITHEFVLELVPLQAPKSKAKVTSR
ncbi:hypothetical protein BH11PSE12_BH11PSE12_19110 [soil metagenome]